MERLLIIGCGDVARRALPALTAQYDVSALVRDAAAQSTTQSTLDALGVRVHHGDLDHPASLAGLGADVVLHSAPPPPHGRLDTRTRCLLAALGANGGEMVARHFVYLSTSGVYGDCAGELVDEARRPNPSTDRARRRLDAEQALAGWCAARGATLTVLRVPGIYAADRLPLARLSSGAPTLRPEEDVYTSHIHADDLAAIVVTALARRDATGVFNACDDTALKAGDWLDLVADRAGLARPPRLSRARAAASLSALQMSFLADSRRLSNRRMKQELGVTLRYPTVCDGVPQTVPAC